MESPQIALVTPGSPLTRPDSIYSSGLLRNRRARSAPIARITGICLVMGLTAVPIAAQGDERFRSMASDPFTETVGGLWHGVGDYQGARLTLSRGWELILGGAVLRAEMGVTMANGASFDALTLWRATGPDRYSVIWMDAAGRSQTLEARREPDGQVTSVFLDEMAEGGPAWRRWTFAPVGKDAYTETLSRLTGDHEEVETVFRFERSVTIR